MKTSQPIPMLSEQDKVYLLALARSSIDLAVNRQPLPEIDMSGLSDILRNDGAAFVTLTKDKHPAWLHRRS